MCEQKLDKVICSTPQLTFFFIVFLCFIVTCSVMLVYTGEVNYTGEEESLYKFVMMLSYLLLYISITSYIPSVNVLRVSSLYVCSLSETNFVIFLTS